MVGDEDETLAITLLVCDGHLCRSLANRNGYAGSAACHFDTVAPRGAGYNAWVQPYSPARTGGSDAAALSTGDTALLSAHLYRYNSLPLTPEWLRRLPDNASRCRNIYKSRVAHEFVGSLIAPGHACRRRQNKARGWLGGQELFRGRRHREHLLDLEVRCSSTCAMRFPPFLPRSLPLGHSTSRSAAMFAGCCARTRWSHTSAIGLHSKKLLAVSPESFPAVRRRACRSLPEFDCGPLMSWGSDPPLEEAVPVWLRRQSWRQWICNRLGAALAVAKHHSHDSVPAWRFALTRLQLEGVDPDELGYPVAGLPTRKCYGGHGREDVGPLVLPDDVEIVPVTALSAAVRAQIGGADDDYAVTRPLSRVPSKIVNSQAAAWLLQFKKPTTLVCAILRHSEAVERKPEEVLEDIYPFLESCLHAKLLVEPGVESQMIQPSFASGTEFAGHRIEECIQVLADTELYRVTHQDGQAALKITRPEAGVQGIKREFRTRSQDSREAERTRRSSPARVRGN